MRSVFRKLLAFRFEIPAVTLGGVIDAVIPMAGRGRLLFRAGKALIVRPCRAAR